MSSYGSARKAESKYPNTGTNTALAAVALQDHLMRNLSLRDPLLLNRHRVPVHKPKQWRKEARATIDTGRGNIKGKKKKDEEKEYVLDPKLPPPTLAQRMGLVEAPAQALTEDEWKNAKEKSNKRDDSRQPCVICKEEFGFQEQVLLSCTHVFHRACLQAFERFTGRKTCPMCRKERYQTRVIHEGARVYRHQCASKIQAAWRGYVVRCWYKKLQETNPPKDPRLRSKFYQEKLSSITDRMIRSLDCDVGGFLREIDANIQASRDIMRQFEDAMKQISNEEWEQIQLKAIERGNKECPICLTPLDEEGLIAQQSRAIGPYSEAPGADEQKFLPKNTKSTSPAKSLHQLKTNRHGNGSHDQTPSFPAKISANRKEADHSNRAKQTGKIGPRVEADGPMQLDCDVSRRRCTVLLSCSHVFHHACVLTFEEFSLGEKRHLCPVCRTNYQKKVL